MEKNDGTCLAEVKKTTRLTQD